MVTLPCALPEAEDSDVVVPAEPCVVTLPSAEPEVLVPGDAVPLCSWVDTPAPVVA
ncbi:MAG: hypothetical protein FJ027_04260 [Candidatus Rokubacteria bacterium]|nr:hypothetical protein [Candidatus Rokubacteria bacterium]